MALAVSSRFSLLKVEDDDDLSDREETQRRPHSGKSQNQSVNAKKKQKKKKKNDTSKTETDELRNLAFGGGGSGKHKPLQHQHRQNAPSSAPVQQWEEWRNKDEEFTAETYEKELQEALLQSKLDFEARKEFVKATDGVGDADKGQSNKPKKKKRANIQPVMTLEEFNRSRGGGEQLNGKTSSVLDEIEDVTINPVPTVKTQPLVTEAGRKFFDKVEQDVGNIIRKEKIQEEYRKQYAVENAMTAKFQDDLESKDKEIMKLKATVQNYEDELKQVKKRNKQLCHILGQGEMKDKAEILVQMDQLTQVKDELTEEVTELRADLEKERSKVHALKSEVDKLKGNKHTPR